MKRISNGRPLFEGKNGDTLARRRTIGRPEASQRGRLSLFLTFLLPFFFFLIEISQGSAKGSARDALATYTQ